MGLVAISGGSLTMIGSGALIILNDLLVASGEEAFGFFAVTPVGFLLLCTAILYFLFLGPYVLPVGHPEAHRPGSQEDLVDTWHLPTGMHHYYIPATSPLDGREREDVRLKADYSLHLLAINEKSTFPMPTWRQNLRSRQDMTHSAFSPYLHTEQS